jgi:hypothetical protein
VGAALERFEGHIVEVGIPEDLLYAPGTVQD